MWLNKPKHEVSSYNNNQNNSMQEHDLAERTVSMVWLMVAGETM